MTTVLGLNDKIPDLSVRQLRFIENRCIRPTIELRFIEKKKLNVCMLWKKRKRSFSLFWSSRSLFLVNCIFCVKKLKLKQVVYHTKVFPSDKNSFFSKKNQKYFHGTYFNSDIGHCIHPSITSWRSKERKDHYLRRNFRAHILLLFIFIKLISKSY